MISIIIFATVILNVELTVGQISGQTKCTSSSLSTCAYSQIRCPPNYYFNGQFCLPVLGAAAQPAVPPPSIPAPFVPAPFVPAPFVPAPVIPASVIPAPTQPPETHCSPSPPNVVKPIIPDPLPVKPVCESFYEWNGNECYQILSNEPVCPNGHKLTDNGECISEYQPLCQENYFPNGYYCVGVLEVPVECPINFYWNGNMCVQRIIPSCPEGFVLNNGFCELYNTGGCPSGTLMDNFKCIGHHQVQIQCDYEYYYNGTHCVNSTNSCDEGFYLKNNVCEKNITKSADFECPPRTQMLGNQCISVEMICPKGFTLIDSLCIQQNTPTNLTSSVAPNCTIGYVLVGCECVKIIETIPLPPTPICPPNYVFKDGFCYFERDIRPPACPTNYENIDGKCVPKLPEDSALICPPGHKLVDSICVFEELPATPTICPAGQIQIYGVCVPLPKCPQIDCQSNFTSSCECPVGYTLVNRLCVIIGQGSNPCPSDYQWINGTCVLTSLPGAKVCPPGHQRTNGSCVVAESPVFNPCTTEYQWTNGTCVLLTNGSNICPPGHQLENGKCVLTENPDYSICPPGSQWENGSCIVITQPDLNFCIPGYQRINGNCVPSENPNISPCPTGYQWSNGSCVNIFEPGFNVCPPGYQLINGTCVHFTIVPPDRNGTLQPPEIPINPILPPVVQPCSPIPSSPCQPCPVYNVSRCPNCPQVTNYITKDGHISITNIVHVNHHHQRPPRPSNVVDWPSNVHIIDNDEESIDYDTNAQNATDEGDINKKCCEIITPRQCKRNGDEWTCFHRKYQRCGDICTQPKIYLKPKMVYYQPPVLIMPPPPRRIYGRRRMFTGGSVDCSGCIHGGYRCSVECYTYPDCSWSDCTFVDQHTYCEEWDPNETEGCSTDDGYFE